MPELPEAEYNRQIIHRNCLNQRITKVKCAEDSKIFNVPAVKVQKFLLRQTIVDTGRHGKYFWCSLGNKSQLLIHLGMTGFVQVRGKSRSIYRSAPEKEQSEAWPPRFAKLLLTFEHDVELVYGDSRRFGRIRVFPDVARLRESIKKLGFDPILTPSPASLDLLVKHRKVPMKSLLLDQTFCAGIGNWMADDILYHAAIHPQTRACELSEEEWEALLRSILYISTTACALRLEDTSYPPEWLFHCRWDAAKAKAPLLHNNEKICVVRISGRTTLFSPLKQKRNKI